MSASLNWDVDVFASCYNAIKVLDSVPDHLGELLGHDLQQLLLVPNRSEKSANALKESETKSVKFPNGGEYRLNKPFIESVSILASELNLDELCAAELLQASANESFSKGSSLEDAGRLMFFRRYDYILNIAGYIILNKQTHLLGSDPNLQKSLFENCLLSFKKIYALVQSQNDQIDKQKATADINNLGFVNKTVFMKKQLFAIHDLLSQILFSLIDSYSETFLTWDTYDKLTKHIKENISDDFDTLILHLVPSLFRIVQGLDEMKDAEVNQLHLQIHTSLKADFTRVKSPDNTIDISKSSLRVFELVSALLFFVSFIPWCKKDSARTAKYDFKGGILQYIEWLISYGTFEQILNFAAESARPEAINLLENRELYDFRPLLQRTLPKLTPQKFVYSGTPELIHATKARPDLQNISKLIDHSSLRVSSTLSELLIAPALHLFFCDFINHAAIVLTLLRDSEEDFLLSSLNRRQLEVPEEKSNNSFNDDYENIVNESRSLSSKSSRGPTEEGIHDLDNIASRADLERLYLAFSYTYYGRRELCDAFWAVDDPNILGFVTWGIANNTLPLITATFCMLLGSLSTSGISASTKLWDILLNAGTLRKNDYSKISIDSIINSLSYYYDALMANLEYDLNLRLKNEQKKLEFLFSSGYNSRKEATSSPDFSIQLSEDSVVFIAGFFMLISEIVHNSKDGTQTGSNLVKSAFTRFFPIITDYLKFDNLIVSAKAMSADSRREITPILFNDSNRATLINLILKALSDFASATDSDPEIRYEIWNCIDRWLNFSLFDSESSSNASETSRYTGIGAAPSGNRSVKSELSKLKNFNRNSGIKQGFQLLLTSRSQVINFVYLIKNLLPSPPLPCDITNQSTLPFPVDIGANYRYKNQIGIWPYFEFISLKVLKDTNLIEEKDARVSLQGSILQLLLSSLESIDWKFILGAAPSLLHQFPDIDDVLAKFKNSNGDDTTVSLRDIVRLHHSVAILDLVFDERMFNVLFSIIDLGFAPIDDDTATLDLVSLALRLLDRVLDTQDIYIGRLLPLLKNGTVIPESLKAKQNGYGTSLSLILSAPKRFEKDIYYPSNVGTKGVSDFYEIILFHLSSVAQIALYVGNQDATISQAAIRVLSKVASLPVFSSKSALSSERSLSKTKLCSVLESVDESVKIQYAMVQQIETISDSLRTKQSIIKFLVHHLVDRKEMTVAHFLLGYETRGGVITLKEDHQKISLLKSLVELLLSTVDLIFDVDYSKGYIHRIDEGPSKLASSIMEVIVCLCKSPLTSRVTLQFLRKFDLFQKLLTVQPQLDTNTLWPTLPFQGDVQTGSPNDFLQSESNTDTFLSFIQYRNLILQYLSFEFHDVQSSTRQNHYVKLLTEESDFLNGTPRILSFVDVLNFQFSNYEVQEGAPYEAIFDVMSLLRLVKEERMGRTEDNVVSSLIVLLEALGYLRNIYEIEMIRGEPEAGNGVSSLNRFLDKTLAVDELQTLHMKCMRGWVQMIQVLTMDGVLDKCDFILKVLQMVLPKINNDYFERNILYAEELMSLCVVLFDMYEEDSVRAGAIGHHLHKLLPLFKTCVSGVLSSNSTPALRADLYLVLNKFVLRSIDGSELLPHVLGEFRLLDRKFIDVVCSDSIYSEGSPRITSIILMESLIGLSWIAKLSTMLDAMVENNLLSLLVRLLKRTGEIMDACNDTATSAVRVDTLLYELTAFKATLYLLVKIAQNRAGASSLIENEIFSVLLELKFLRVDSELGTDLHIQTGDVPDGDTTAPHVTVKISLDVPLTLRSESSHAQTQDSSTISYYEMLVPAFQLVATILSAMGPSYRPGIVQVRELMRHFGPLISGVLKRDALLEKQQIPYYETDSLSTVGLQLLVKLFVVINCFLDS